MPLGRTRDPFSHPEWLFEVKWDGFRALAYADKSKCSLISRNGNQFTFFPALAESYLPNSEPGQRFSIGT